MANTDGICLPLTETLNAGQVHGKVDPGLDLKRAGAGLVAEQKSKCTRRLLWPLFRENLILQRRQQGDL